MGDWLAWPAMTLAPPLSLEPPQCDVPRPRWRRWRRPAIFVAVLAAVVGPIVAFPGAEPVPAAIPDRLHVPPIYTFGVTMSAPGPAAVIFKGQSTSDGWNEGRLAVVAAGSDRYRVVNEFPGTLPGTDGLLSPDGRLFTAQKGVVDLSDSDVVMRYGDEQQLGFAPVSNRLMTVRWTDEMMPEYPRTADWIAIHDLDGTAPPVRVRVDAAVLPSPKSTALSVDDRSLAVVAGYEIRIFHLAAGGGTPTLVAQFPVRVATTLGGGGAWRPDGAALATQEWQGDRWTIVERDVRDWRPTPDAGFPGPRPGEDLRIIGLRQRTAVAPVARGDAAQHA